MRSTASFTTNSGTRNHSRGLTGLPGIVSIHDRPAEIAERLVPGHWEGDTIKGRYNRSAVGTLVKRKTLFVTLAKMNGTGAEAAVEGFSTVLARIDAQHRLSMTYDQGKEMSRHKDPNSPLTKPPSTGTFLTELGTACVRLQVLAISSAHWRGV